MTTTTRVGLRATMALLLLAIGSSTPAVAGRDDTSGDAVAGHSVVLVDVPAHHTELVAWAVGLFR